MRVKQFYTSGSGAMDETYHVGEHLMLMGYLTHFSGSSGSAQNIELILHSDAGNEYSTKIREYATANKTDIVDTGILLPVREGDHLNIKFPNQDSVTWALRLLFEKE